MKRFLGCVREYKKATIITLILIVGEAAIETFIPFITADLVNQINGGVEMGNVVRTGILLVVMAIFSLSFGGVAGFTCSKASATR